MDEGDDSVRVGKTLLAETFGVALLSYLCGTDEGLMRARLDANAVLPTDAEAILLGPLVSLAQRIVSSERANPDRPPPHAFGVLALPVGEGDWSLANALRLEAGGELAEGLIAEVADDAVKSALAHMAIDVYAVLLAPRERDWYIPLHPLLHHPRHVDLQSAIKADPDLRRLFPHEEPDAMLYTSTHPSGIQAQSELFALIVIQSAWNTASMQAEVPTVEQLVKTAHRHVDILRDAAAGKPTKLRCLVTFTGFVTADGATVPTPWGPLRPLTDVERSLAPPALEGVVSHTDAEGKHLSVTYVGDMVLETALDYEIKTDPASAASSNPIRGGGRDGAVDGGTARPYEAMRRRCEGLELALLLAVKRSGHGWPTARQAWTWIDQPFDHGRTLLWRDVQSAPPFTPYKLSAADCDALSSWTEAVESGWVSRGLTKKSSIDIAVRRVVQAANGRTDRADRLVDAVIAWENMFAAETEATLRVSAAMAWLLESDDPTSRGDLQNKLKNLYGARSKVVHGQKDVKDPKLPKQSDDALGYAIDALSRLLGDRRDILALDGAERSLHLILGLRGED